MLHERERCTLRCERAHSETWRCVVPAPHPSARRLPVTRVKETTRPLQTSRWQGRHPLEDALAAG
eukprot:scaffold19253_cov124-Isochrysis_galbana.AAC.7